jgi:CBS domain-containing protein
MIAEELMTRTPATVTSQATLAQVWDLMRELDIRHVPVVDDGDLVGMLSDRDLAALDVARLLSLASVDALRRELSRPVVDLMASDVIFAEPDTDLGDIIEMMLETKVGALPVVRPETREVVGIVSYIDVLRVCQTVLDGAEGTRT